MYKSIIRPLLFRIEPEKVHHLLMATLKLYRHFSPLRAFVRKHYEPQQRIMVWRNWNLKNRIALAAGFDKNAECFDELADFGFAMIEVGTVTPEAVKGNQRPRIFRIPLEEALLSRTGFNNIGMEKVKNNLTRKQRDDYKLGININTNHPEDKELAVKELLDLYATFMDKADYFTLNWGTMDADLFKDALIALRTMPERKEHPILIKLPADVSQQTLTEVMELAQENGADGFIATGPTQDRTTIHRIPKTEIEAIGAGGISGHPVFEKSLGVVKFLSEQCNENMLIVGAGGVMDIADVNDMLMAGADMVQIYSALVYEGPSVAKEMSKDFL